MSLDILYEDNHLIAVYKPAGILVQGDKNGDISLLALVKKYLKEKYKKPGNVFVGLVHRLDRPVSGIILFAKTSKGASRLSEQFRDRTIRKIYYAVVEGEIKPKEGVLRNNLVKQEDIRKSIVSDEGDEAELYYQTKKYNKNYSFIKVELKTGRFHQIRAQFSVAGYPIVGDKKYGSSKVFPDQSICLCSTEIEFQKATSSEIVKLSIPYPKEWEKYFK